jgi:small subunit ribosomal protein S6
VKNQKLPEPSRRTGATGGGGKNLKTYEGMFLLEAGQPNFEEACAPVRTIFERSGVEVLHMKKWDERRLTYDIRGRRRGLYVLAYFKADPAKITQIERDANLDEKVLRSLILLAEEVSAETMAAKTPAETHVGGAGERERGDDDDRDYRPRRREYGDDRGDYRGDRDRDRGERSDRPSREPVRDVDAEPAEKMGEVEKSGDEGAAKA